MNRFHTFVLIALSAMVATSPLTTRAASPGHSKPTVILVHGAFAESASWDGVVAELLNDGYPVVAIANPLRGVKSDADYLGELVAKTAGDVVLVGHSYGGAVISNTSNRQGKIKALVYVAAFAPEVGESCLGLSGQFPGSTLGPALAAPVGLVRGASDLYIQQEKFHEQFAADVPASEARKMAATQRPILDAALAEKSGDPLWKGMPTWFIYGTADKNIPLAAHQFMAKRAGSQKTLEMPGASHVVMISHAKKVAELIEEAAEK